MLLTFQLVIVHCADTISTMPHLRCAAANFMLMKKSKNMRITVEGELLNGVGSKDVILHVIGVIGTAGGNGHVIEFGGQAIKPVWRRRFGGGRVVLLTTAVIRRRRIGFRAPFSIDESAGGCHA